MFGLQQVKGVLADKEFAVKPFPKPRSSCSPQNCLSLCTQFSMWWLRAGTPAAGLAPSPRSSHAASHPHVLPVGLSLLWPGLVLPGPTALCLHPTCLGQRPLPRGAPQGSHVSPLQRPWAEDILLIRPKGESLPCRGTCRASPCWQQKQPRVWLSPCWAGLGWPPPEVLSSLNCSITPGDI